MSRAAIMQKYEERCLWETDIREHLQTLREYASHCDSIVEFGSAHCNSTWALLAGGPKKMTAVDIIRHDPWFEEVEMAAAGAGIDFKFVIADSAKVDIEPTDLLFIDSEHTFTQLVRELERHAGKVKKFIILHDTESFKEELLPAIASFISYHTEWSVKEHFTNNNGLTVLIRK